LSSQNIDEEWSRLEQEIYNCTKCRLHLNRRKAVPGEGNRKTLVVFIGEAPGEKERRKRKTICWSGWQTTHRANRVYRV